jgi:hypothetical protein
VGSVGWKLHRPWRKVLGLLGCPTAPVPFGLWLMNTFCQRVLGINKEHRFMIHFTSRVVGRVTIGRNVWLSFAISGGCYIQGLNGIEIGDDNDFCPWCEDHLGEPLPR